MLMCLCSTETADSFLARAPGLTTMKRHSEGTFSNDYSKYLETRRAQDFVQWLMNAKRNGYELQRNNIYIYTTFSVKEVKSTKTERSSLILA